MVDNRAQWMKDQERMLSMAVQVAQEVAEAVKAVAASNEDVTDPERTVAIGAAMLLGDVVVSLHRIAVSFERIADAQQRARDEPAVYGAMGVAGAGGVDA